MLTNSLSDVNDNNNGQNKRNKVGCRTKMGSIETKGNLWKYRDRYLVGVCYGLCVN